jgi:small subunit ribosomal protein S8
MSMTDPIADMLTRIRNAQLAEKATVQMPTSKVKVAIAKVLKDEATSRLSPSSARKPAAAGDRVQVLRRPPGHREDRARVQAGTAHLQGKDDIPRVMNGLGIAIVSTSRGVMTDRKARATGVGGEVLCIVA